MDRVERPVAPNCRSGYLAYADDLVVFIGRAFNPGIRPAVSLRRGRPAKVSLQSKRGLGLYVGFSGTDQIKSSATMLTTFVKRSWVYVPSDRTQHELETLRRCTQVVAKGSAKTKRTTYSDSASSRGSVHRRIVPLSSSGVSKEREAPIRFAR